MPKPLAACLTRTTGGRPVIDGYSLYALLKDGDAHQLEVGGSPYRFEFKGETPGSRCWLSVSTATGETQRWGWGRGSETCFHALADLANGWPTHRKHPYKPYGSTDNGESHD